MISRPAASPGAGVGAVGDLRSPCRDRPRVEKPTNRHIGVVMKRRLAIALTAGALALGTPIMAHADSCANVSRAAPTNYVPGSGPLVEGNWVWLPSIGVPVQAWGFAPPG